MRSTLLVFAVALFAFSSCKKEEAKPKVYKVTYNIGCSDCMVAYVKDTNGGQASEYHQATGWSYSFDAKLGQEVLLMAYNTSDHPQGVTATIKLNDSILVTQTNYCAISGTSFVVDTIR
ncbi:MAG: hypothetical protein U0V74_00745 [Chitinophagales bacterium]